MERFCFSTPEPISLPIKGSAERFPINRVYCVGRNYGKHVVEMGGSLEKSEPVFFTKPPSAVIDCSIGKNTKISYPSASADVHHEVELVLCLKSGGVDIKHADALDHIFGCSVGVDLTRRDLQQKAKSERGPWDVAKAFDRSAPMGAITLLTENPLTGAEELRLSVNDVERQNGSTADMIWSPAEIIASLSRYFELRAGDVIFTGTPEGVGAINRGEKVKASITGLEPLAFEFI